MPAAGAKATTRGVKLKSWDTAPLFRWQQLRRLERVQAEITSLREAVGGAESPPASGHSGDYALSFVAKMQAMLPALCRPRCSVAFLCPWPATALEPEPEPQHQPEPQQAAIEGLARFRVHFHIMPGSWAMVRFGEPPAGFFWGIAIFPLMQRFQRQRGAVETLRLDTICFKPHFDHKRLQAATTNDHPIIVLRTTDNPLRLPYRCIDGKHRINKLLAAGETRVRCRVLDVAEVEEFVTALPLCALPPLRLYGAEEDGFGDEEDLALACAAGALRRLITEGLASPPSSSTIP